MEMKAYLDNNIVSSIARDDTASESDALDALMAAYDAGKVDLVTSELTLDEIKKYSSPSRKQVERLFGYSKKFRWFGGMSCSEYIATAISTLGSPRP